MAVIEVSGYSGGPAWTLRKNRQIGERRIDERLDHRLVLSEGSCRRMDNVVICGQIKSADVRSLAGGRIKTLQLTFMITLSKMRGKPARDPYKPVLFGP